MTAILEVIGLIILIISGVQLVLRQDRIWLISSQAMAVLGLFVLYVASAPLLSAVIKLITGWMTCAILGSASYLRQSHPQKSWVMSYQVFKAITYILLLVIAFIISGQAQAILPGVPRTLITGSSMMILTGLLIISLNHDPFLLILGLLSILLGFSIVYSMVEPSLLVEIMYSGLLLSLALVGTYLTLTEGAAKPE